MNEMEKLSQKVNGLSKKPTEKQLKFLADLGYEMTEDDRVLMNRFQASELISHLLEEKDVERQWKEYITEKYEYLVNQLSCPVCHHKMVVRFKRGDMANVFFGCSNYPECPGRISMVKAKKQVSE